MSPAMDLSIECTFCGLRAELRDDGRLPSHGHGQWYAVAIRAGAAVCCGLCARGRDIIACAACDGSGSAGLGELCDACGGIGQMVKPAHDPTGPMVRRPRHVTRARVAARAKLSTRAVKVAARVAMSPKMRAKLATMAGGSNDIATFVDLDGNVFRFVAPWLDEVPRSERSNPIIEVPHARCNLCGASSLRVELISHVCDTCSTVDGVCVSCNRKTGRMEE